MLIIKARVPWYACARAYKYMYVWSLWLRHSAVASRRTNLNVHSVPVFFMPKSIKQKDSKRYVPIWDLRGGGHVYAYMIIYICIYGTRTHVHAYIYICMHMRMHTYA